MKKKYSDEDLRNILGSTNIESAVMDERITETLTAIRQNKKNNDKRRKQRIRLPIGVARGFGIAAAAFLLAFGICAANPALAAEIPVFGNIFEKVWKVFSYGKIPEEETVQLQDGFAKPGISDDSGGKEEADKESAGGRLPASEAESDTGEQEGFAYQDTDSGFTITFTEYYATDQAIYFGIRVESKEELPELATMGETNYQLMQLATREDFSFREDTVSGVWPVEGRQEDAYTFEGIMRMDYEKINVDDRRYNAACKEADEKGEPYPEVNADTYDEWFDEIDVPDEFEFDMQIYRIWAYSTKLQGRYEKLGEWNFSFHIKQSDSGIRSIQVGEVNEQGIGVDYIELTPIELSVYTTEPRDGQCYTVALDKDGLALPGGDAYWSGENVKNEMMVGAHDISVITVYICDYDGYMEIDKTLMTPGEFKARLEEISLFKTKIRTDTGDTAGE